MAKEARDMRDPIVGNRFAGALLALVLALSFTGTAAAAEFWLQAETLTKTMPDATVITMWGFAECAPGHASCNPATVPGPRLVVPPGDSNLTIHLKNNLTGPFTEPVSIVIPGQITAMSPVWIDTTGTVVSQGSRPPGDVTSRMRSFTAETAVGATGNYTWTNLKPGTYLYHSGTHPAVQVQMGLYGALTHDAAALNAYSGVSYGNEVVLLFSDIDPVLHAHVAAGTYGTPPPAGITSTIDFDPKYFLINGEPFTAGHSPIPSGKPGNKLLLRFLNAGLRDYAPVLQGLHMNIVAENGNLFPHPRSQYSLLLSAGKTNDALVTAAKGGKVAIYDRRLNLTNNLIPGGGLMTFLQFTTTNPDTTGVFRPSTGELFMKNANSTGFADLVFNYGLPGDQPIVGDWNGNGITTLGIYRNGDFYLRNSNTVGFADIVFTFGQAGDLPIAGDWNGDGIATVGVYRNGIFYLRNSNNAGLPDATFALGVAGDLPIAGDWNGDGIDTVGVFRPSTGVLFLKNTNATGFADIVLAYGLPGDKPVTGDWDGDGVDTIGVYRDGIFMLRNSNTNGFADIVFALGIPGDEPIAGDWDGLP